MLAGWMHQDWSVTNQANWHPVVRLKGFAAQYIVSQMKSTDDQVTWESFFISKEQTGKNNTLSYSGQGTDYFMHTLWYGNWTKSPLG